MCCSWRFVSFWDTKYFTTSVCFIEFLLHVVNTYSSPFTVSLLTMVSALCSQHAFTLLTQCYPKDTKLPKIDLDLFFKTHTWLGVIDSNYYSRNQNPVSYLWTNTQYLTDNYILISQQYFFNRNIFLIKKARFLWLLKCIIIYFLIDILSFF